MRFLSVCSGIEAASGAWEPLGWKAVAFSEIEPFPCAVLAHHYPTTPNWGDMNKYEGWPDVSIDLLCGGTPCQSFSVAGLRRGLADPRGDLMLTFGAIAAKYRPRWLVWENVPGVLSSNGGRDFGTFLGMLGQLGYGFAYRVLDAQYFGVAQRRRRVFVVGCLGDWRSAAAVLFERHSMCGDTAPSREARQTAPTIPSRSTAGGGLGTDFDCDGGTICVATGQAGAEIGAEIGADMAPTLNCNHEAPYVAHSLRGEGFDASEDGTGRGTPLVPVAMINMQGSKGNAVAQADGPSFTLNAMHGHDMHAVAVPVGVTIHGTDPTVQKVASYDELAQCLRARTPGNIDNSSTTVVQQPVAYGIRTANTSANGHGISPELAHTLDRAQGQCVAFDTTQITSAAKRSNLQPGDACHPLASGAHAPAIAFPANLSGTQCASTEELAPSMGAANPTAVAYGIRTANTSSNGWGIQEECTHTLDCAQGVAVAVALRGREGGATAELGDEVQNCLRASSGDGDKPHVLCETLYNKGFNHGGLYASTQETHAGKILRTLREAVGEEAFAQWGLGILGSLQSPEILRQALHGLSIRPAAFSRSWVVHCALSRSENGSGWLLQSLREAGCEGCASQGLEPFEQLARQLRAYLSELSHPGAQAARFLHDLWQAAEGPGLLREALSAVQEVGRSANGQRKPVHAGAEGFGAAGAEGLQGAGLHREIPRDGVLQQACAASESGDSGCSATEQERGGQSRLGQTPFAVRRLTCEEAEFLQGFPRSYTAIPWRNKPASECPDGPRYRALGNSWAIPVAAWLGKRIQELENGRK